MNTWTWFSKGCLALTAALATACATAPPVRLHSLQPADPAPRAAAAGAGFVVTLAPVSVPPQVDQAQWLVRIPDGSLALLEQERWAAPLRSELRSALLDRWVTRWAAVEAVPAPAGTQPTMQPTTQPSTQPSTQASAATWRVVVDVTRFESFPGREARLDTRWSAQRSGQAGAGGAVACRSVVRESVGDGMLALAEGHRRALARFADDVALHLAAVQRGEAPQCAGSTD
jgi:uncharacterized protein